jgi:hypothetical protein
VGSRECERQSYDELELVGVAECGERSVEQVVQL